MTVKELKELLNKYDENATVYFDYGGTEIEVDVIYNDIYKIVIA